MMWVRVGGLMVAVSIAAGAFGAHALAERLDEYALGLWDTGARYLALAGIGALVVGLLAGREGLRHAGLAGSLLASGGLVFAGTLWLMALGAPRWLGAVTPLGGLGMIAGFVVLAFSWQG